MPSEVAKYVVGIGTSAGGLGALQVFFEHLPGDCAQSFVVVQHLSPTHKSLMPELLAKSTKLPVYEVRDGMELGHGVYVLPPKKNIELVGDRLQLTQKPVEGALNLPIDIFFRSLAREKEDKAIGLILTGTGSDGTRGLRAIKEAGGMVMVQDPEQAEFTGMPHSAINTGLADFILPLERMPDELLRYIEFPHDATYQSLASDPQVVQMILTHIHSATQVSFARYKWPTLLRRIARRARLHRCESIAAYLELLFQSKVEAEQLSREFLIGVTRFFRDPFVWDELAAMVLPEIVHKKIEQNTPIKCWVAGCSTGEEVYTLAMLLHEELERQGSSLEVRIFATDLLHSSIEFASKGLYPISIANDLTQERLSRFFFAKEGEYQIADFIRRMVVFSRHNLLTDAPFGKMDLVQCRNLLIYIEPEGQQLIFNSLHYALNLDGFLLLGRSESVDESHAASLAVVHRKARVYRNVQLSRRLHHWSTGAERQLLPQTPIHASQRSLPERRLSELMSETITEELGVVGILIDGSFEIHRVSGPFRKFAELPEDGFSNNLLKLLPASLSTSVRTALYKLERTKEPVTYRGVKLPSGAAVQLKVAPFEGEGSSVQSPAQKYLVLLFPQLSLDPADEAGPEEESGYIQKIKELETALEDSKASLRTTLERAELGNEELQVTNEELLVTNEELQTTNEELQSVNEELHTVNYEYQQKLVELEKLHTELNNLVKSRHIGTLFLDEGLRIRRMTPAIREQFFLEEQDVGRPLSHFASAFGEGGSQSILEQARSVLETQIPVRSEMRTRKGTWFLQQIDPYHNSQKEAVGVVLSFINIDDRKRVEEELRKNEALLRSVVESTPATITMLDPKGRVLFVNHLVEGIPMEEYIGSSVYQWLPPHLSQQVRDSIEEATRTKKPVQYENHFRDPSGDTHYFFHVASPVLAGDELLGMTILSHDVTQLNALDAKVRRQRDQLERSNKELQQFAYVAAHDLQEPLRTISGLTRMLGADYREKLDEDGQQLVDFILDGSERMSLLVNGLLDYALLGRDRKLRDVDCGELLKQVEASMAQAIQDAGAVIECEALPTLHAAPPELHMLFQNLLGNALKFRHRERSPHIHISAREADEEWVFAVRDNGIGIREEYLDRIFMIFRRLHTQEEHSGVGIGLAHCQKIASLHQGKIWVESTLGEGSTFFVSIAKGLVSVPNPPEA